MDGSISCLSSWAWEPALSEESMERGVCVKTLGLISLSAGAKLAKLCGVGGGSEGLDL